MVLRCCCCAAALLLLRCCVVVAALWLLPLRCAVLLLAVLLLSAACWFGLLLVLGLLIGPCGQELVVGQLHVTLVVIVIVWAQGHAAFRLCGGSSSPATLTATR